MIKLLTIFFLSKKTEQKIYQSFSPKKVGIAITGFEVDHAHMHIVPLYRQHEITSSSYIHANNPSFSEENLIELSDTDRTSIIKKLKT